MSRPTILAVFLLMALPSGMDANAQTRDDLATAARAFDEGACGATTTMPRQHRFASARVRSTSPSGIRAWPLDWSSRPRRAVRRIAIEAAVIVEDVAADDPSADFVVGFDENESASGKRNCLSLTWWIGLVDLSQRAQDQSRLCRWHRWLHHPRIDACIWIQLPPAWRRQAC